MKLAEDLTSLEIIAIAAKTELDAAEFYREFAKKVKNPLVKRKIERLGVEEESHAKTLTDEYKRMSGGEEPMTPKGFTTGIKKNDAPNFTPEQLIEEAMAIEKRAQEFYQEAAKRSEDPRGRQVLEYLSMFEADHYRVLETELRMMKRNPDWFEMENDLLHIGP